MTEEKKKEFWSKLFGSKMSPGCYSFKIEEKPESGSEDQTAGKRKTRKEAKDKQPQSPRSVAPGRPPAVAAAAAGKPSTTI